MKRALFIGSILVAWAAAFTFPAVWAAIEAPPLPKCPLGDCQLERTFTGLANPPPEPWQIDMDAEDPLRLRLDSKTTAVRVDGGWALERGK